MYLPIDKAAIPYEFDVDLGGITFTIELNYNTRLDFFTVDLSIGDELIVEGDKVVYGQPLFSGVTDNRLPTVPITPLDLAGKETRVGIAQLDETVLLIVGDTTA